MNQQLQALPSRDIRLDKCSVFRVDLPPPHRPIAVRAQPDRTLRRVLQPILRHQFLVDFESVECSVKGTGVILKDDVLVGALSCKHIVVQKVDQVKGGCVFILC